MIGKCAISVMASISSICLIANVLSPTIPKRILPALSAFHIVSPAQHQPTVISAKKPISIMEPHAHHALLIVLSARMTTSAPNVKMTILFIMRLVLGTLKVSLLPISLLERCLSA